MPDPTGGTPDEPRWGPATTYRAKPSARRRQAQHTGTPAGARQAAVPAPAPARTSEPAYAAASRYDSRDEPSAGHHDDGSDDSSTYGRRRRRGPTVALVLVLLLALAAAYPLLLARTAMGSVSRVDALSGSQLAPTPGRTILVVGSDTREGTDMEAVEGARTDTILLLHRPTSGPTVLLSIPRDSYVEIPGRGENKINAAYALGGPPLLVQTVEQATGVQIDDYVETGLEGFGDVVDAVGGITICPERAMNDPMVGLDIQPGCQPADGETALDYARTRKEDPQGDLGRVQRQREVMAGIAKEGFAPATLLNPFSAFPLAEAGGSALTVDETTGGTDLALFLLAMRDSAGGEGLSLTVPVADTTRRTSSGVVVDWDEARAETVFQALRDSSTEAIRPIAQEQSAPLEQGTG